MERIINLKKENIDKICRIVDEKNSIPIEQSIEKLNSINGEYLSKYCFENEYLLTKEIVFSNGVTKTISSMRGFLVKKEYINLILDIPIFKDNIEGEEITVLSLINLCLKKNLIKEQNIKYYTTKDLELLYNMSRTKRNERITAEILFLDFYKYNDNSKFNAFTLRNHCIKEEKLDRSFFYKRLEDIRYYENILKYKLI